MADPDDLTCQEFVELVTEYVEGALPPAERARFEAHLTDCDYCVDYLAQMRVAIDILGHLREEHISSAARSRLLAVFRDWKRAAGAAPAH
jgi:anti-sigma factor RsiW